MGISSVSSSSSFTNLNEIGVTTSSNTAAIQRQITALQKKIQLEKESKADDAKTKAARLAQYNQQLQELDAQLAQAEAVTK